MSLNPTPNQRSRTSPNAVFTLRFAPLLFASFVALGVGPANAAPSHQLPPTSDGRPTPTRIAFDREASALALADGEGLLRVFDDALDVRLAVEDEWEWLPELALSPGGERLVVAGERLRIFDVSRGETLEERVDGAFFSPTLSADGRYLAVVRVRGETARGGAVVEHRQVEVWDLDRMKQRRRWLLADNTFDDQGSTATYDLELTFANDGRHVFLVENRASTTDAGAAREWVEARVFSRRTDRELVGWHEALADDDSWALGERVLVEGWLSEVALAPDREALGLLLEDGRAIHWDLAAFGESSFVAPTLLDTGARITKAAAFTVTRDGVALADPHVFRRFSLDGSEVERIELRSAWTDARFEHHLAPGGEWMWTQSLDGVAIWTRERADLVACPIQAPWTLGAARFSDDGSTLALLHGDRTLSLWTADSIAAESDMHCGRWVDAWP